MRTPISQDVKHKWVKLDKRVVKLLLELEYDRYKDYIQNDGSVIVKIDKLSYGYVEAAHYWYETLMSAFKINQYAIRRKDKCLFIKHQDNKLALCGTTMDDCLFICKRDDKWIEEQIKMLKDAFKEVTMESDDELGLVGMQISMNRVKKQVVITQPKHVKRIIEMFQVTKAAPMPALEKLMGDE
jgi:hypothetical protein